MSAVYNLVDVESGNLVGSYDTEHEAREIARDAWRRLGTEGVTGLSLIRTESDGTTTLLAEDGELLQGIPIATFAEPANVPTT